MNANCPARTSLSLVDEITVHLHQMKSGLDVLYVAGTNGLQTSLAEGTLADYATLLHDKTALVHALVTQLHATIHKPALVQKHRAVRRTNERYSNNGRTQNHFTASARDKAVQLAVTALKNTLGLEHDAIESARIALLRALPCDDELPGWRCYQDAARKLFGSEGEIEVDQDAGVSVSDDGGAYVQGCCTAAMMNSPLSCRMAF